MRSDLPENTRTVSIPDLKLFSDPSGGLGVTEREGIGVTERECAPSLLSFDSGWQQKKLRVNGSVIIERHGTYSSSRASKTWQTCLRERAGDERGREKDV